MNCYESLEHIINQIRNSYIKTNINAVNNTQQHMVDTTTDTLYAVTYRVKRIRYVTSVRRKELAKTQCALYELDSRFDDLYSLSLIGKTQYETFKRGVGELHSIVISLLI